MIVSLLRALSWYGGQCERAGGVDEGFVFEVFVADEGAGGGETSLDTGRSRSCGYGNVGFWRGSVEGLLRRSEPWTSTDKFL